MVPAPARVRDIPLLVLHCGGTDSDARITTLYSMMLCYASSPPGKSPCYLGLIMAYRDERRCDLLHMTTGAGAHESFRRKVRAVQATHLRRLLRSAQVTFFTAINVRRSSSSHVTYLSQALSCHLDQSSQISGRSASMRSLRGVVGEV